MFQKKNDNTNTGDTAQAQTTDATPQRQSVACAAIIFDIVAASAGSAFHGCTPG